MNANPKIEFTGSSKLPAIDRFHLFNSTIGNSGDAVMISQRARGSSNLPSIISVNPTFLRITGYSESEVLGAPATLVEEATRNMPGLEDVETVSFDSEMFHRSGSLFFVSWTVCKLTNAAWETWIAVFHQSSAQSHQHQ